MKGLIGTVLDRTGPAQDAGAAVVVIDNQPPNVPTGLQATAISDTAIALVWDASTDAGGGVVGGYNVFFNGLLFVTLAANVTAFTKTGLSPSTKYRFQVQAFDSAIPPNYSQPSDPVYQTTQASPVSYAAPTAPTSLSGTYNSGTGKIDLAWTHGTPATGLTRVNAQAQRRVVGTGVLGWGDTNPAATGNGTATALSAAGLAPGNYEFQVREQQSDLQWSAWSAVSGSVTVTAPATSLSYSSDPAGMAGGTEDSTWTGVLGFPKFDLAGGFFAPHGSGGGGSSTFGYTTGGAADEPYNANHAAVSKFVAPAAGTIDAIWLYMNGGDGDGVKGIAYTDSSGEPNALLAVSAPASVTAFQWYRLAVSGSPAFTSGQTIWIGAVLNGSDAAMRYTSTSFQSRHKTSLGYSSPASSWGSSDDTYSAIKFSAYIEYTPVGAYESGSYLNVSQLGAKQNATVTFNSGSATTQKLSVFCRLHGTLATANGYRADWQQDGTVKINKLTGGTATALWTSSAGALAQSAGNTMTLDCNGNSITVKGNGTTLQTVTDSTYNVDGYVGKYAYGSNAQPKLGLFTAAGDSPSGGGGTVSYTSDPSAVADGAEPAIWTDFYLGQIFDISTGKFLPRTSSSVRESFSFINTAILGANQYAQITHGGGSASTVVQGVFCRLNGASKDTPDGYRADWWNNGSLRLIRLDGGLETLLWSAPATTHVPVDGDTLRLDCNGSTIRLLVNGALVSNGTTNSSVTDTAHAGEGYVGKTEFCSGGSVYMRTFSAGGAAPLGSGAWGAGGGGGPGGDPGGGTGGTGGGGGPTFANPFFQYFGEPGENGWLQSLAVSPFTSPRTVLAGGDLFGNAYSMSAGKKWYASTGISGNTGLWATWHPTTASKLWGAGSFGPHRSTDGGKTWVLQRTGMPAQGTTHLVGEDGSTNNHTCQVSTIIYDPAVGTHDAIWAFGGSNNRTNLQYSDGTPDPRWGNGQVWRCTNADATTPSWTKIGDVPGNPSISSACIAANGDLYVATFTGLYKSTNAGVTWTAFPSPGGWDTDGLMAHPSDATKLWCANKFGIIWYCGNATSGSPTWTQVGDGSHGTDVLFPLVRVCVSSTGGVVYVATPAGVMRSATPTVAGSFVNVLPINSGTLKVPAGTAFGGGYLPATMAIDPTDPSGNTVYVFGNPCILKTADGGATWVEVSSTPAGSYGGWRGNGMTGDVTKQVKFNPFRPGQIFSIGADANRIVHSNDYGWSWLAQASGISLFGGSQDVAFSDDNTVFIGTGNDAGASDPMPDGSGRQAVLRSVDGGATWDHVPLPVGVSGDTTAIYTLPHDSQQVWAAVGNSLYYSSNRGMNWSRVPVDLGHVFCLVGDPNDPTGRTIYAGTSYADSDTAGIMRTSDGVHWLSMPNSPHSGTGTYVAVDPTDPTVLYATQHGTGVYKYTGGSISGGVLSGGTWSLVLSHAYARGIAIDPGKHDRIAVTTYDFGTQDVMGGDGVHLSNNGGSSWTTIAAGLPVLQASPISFNPNKSAQLLIGLVGGGSYAIDVGGSTPATGTAIVLGTTAGTAYKVEAEGYDSGGANVAYHCAAGTPTNTAEATGHAITGLASDDWLKWGINPVAGVYDITFHAKSTSAGAGALIHIEANGVNLVGQIALPDAGSYGDVTILGVDLSGATQYLKLHVDKGPASIDYISFKRQ